MSKDPRDNPACGMTASSGYRWWTVFGWWTPDALGIKLGPLTVTTYRYDLDFFGDGQQGVEWFVGIGNRWTLLDTGLRRLRRR